MADGPRLTLQRCPHGVYMISLDRGMTGTRITPQKCCGRWTVLKDWPLSHRDLTEMVHEAEQMKEVLDD